MPVSSPTRSASESVLIHPLSGVLSAYGMGLASLSATRTRSRAQAPRRGGPRRARQDPRAARRRGETRARAPRRRRAAPSPSSPRRISAMPAPTARSPFRWRACAACALCSRSRISSASASSARRRRSRSRRSRSRPKAAASRSPSLSSQIRVAAPAKPHADDAAVHQAGAGTRRRSILRADLAPGHGIAGPALIIEDHQTVVVEPDWEAASHRAQPSPAHPHRQEKAGARRQTGRSGDGRSVQQSLRLDRRADGLCAAKHRALGQHQGAARLLLRHLRRTRAAHRQRAAYPGASRLDGPERRDGAARGGRQAQARRRLYAERAL